MTLGRSLSSPYGNDNCADGASQNSAQHTVALATMEYLAKMMIEDYYITRSYSMKTVVCVIPALGERERQQVQDIRETVSKIKVHANLSTQVAEAS